MSIKKTSIHVISLAIAMLAMSGIQSTAGQPEQQETSTLQLSISPDHKSITDQHGNVVAHFAEGMEVRPAVSASESKRPSAGPVALQGCMRCKDECIRWEGEQCVQKVRSCTWDFDCKK